MLDCLIIGGGALPHGAARDSAGCLEVDARQQTTVYGLYAAGDVVDRSSSIKRGDRACRDSRHRDSQKTASYPR